MKPIIGYDMDGVLSNFIGPYQTLAHLIQGGEPVHHGDQDIQTMLRTALNPAIANQWHDPEDYYGDLPIEMFDVVFRFIEANDFAFWSGLPNLVSDDDRLKMVGLNAYYDTHYITARRGRPSVIREATLRWLQKNNFPVADIEHIHVSGTKGQLAYRLGVSAFIDDDPGKCASLRMAHVPDVFMAARRYNEGIDVSGVRRCTLTEYIRFLIDSRGE